MLKLKTKWFDRWRKKNSISDNELGTAIENVTTKLSSESLGSNLFKIRIPRSGEGKRGGYRTLLVYKESQIAVFVYGFAKNQQANINKNELDDFRQLAKDIADLDMVEINQMLMQKSFINIESDQ